MVPCAEGPGNRSLIAWQKSAAGIVAVGRHIPGVAGNEPRKAGRTHPGEGPNGTTGEYLGK